MERRNYTVMLLLVVAIIEVHSSFLEIFNAQDNLESIGSFRVANDYKHTDDIPLRDEDQVDSLLPATYVGRDDKRIKRTPGAPSDSSKKLDKLTKAIAQLGITPAVSQPQDIAATRRRNLIIEFERFVTIIRQRYNLLNRQQAVARAMSEHEALANEIIEAANEM